MFIILLFSIPSPLQWSTDITSHVPLTQAVELGRTDIVKLLLKHKDINPNAFVSKYTNIQSKLTSFFYMCREMMGSPL